MGKYMILVIISTTMVLIGSLIYMLITLFLSQHKFDKKPKSFKTKLLIVPLSIIIIGVIIAIFAFNSIYQQKI